MIIAIGSKRRKKVTSLLGVGMLLVCGVLPGTLNAAVSGGVGWQRTTINAPNSNSTTAAIEPHDVYVIDSAEGLVNAPIPQSMRDDLAADFEPSATASVGTPQNTQVVIDAAVADAVSSGNETAYAQYCDPDDPSATCPTTAAAATTAGLLCKSKWKTKTWSLAPAPFDQNLANAWTYQQGSASGSATLSGILHGAVNGTVNVQYKRTRVLCVPYSFRLDSASFTGSLELQNAAGQLVPPNSEGKATDGVKLAVNGQLNANWSANLFNVGLFSPKIYSNWFWIGPIPVYVGVDLPIVLGADVSASLQANANYSAIATGSYSLNIACTRSDCSNDGKDDIHATTSLDASANVKVTLEPYLDTRLRAYLYTTGFLYASAGVETRIVAKYWAGASYQGCGDADGNGVNETVNGSAKQADLDLSFVAALDGFFMSKRSWRNAPFYHKVMYFEGEGSVFSPMIVNSSDIRRTGAGISAVMRPCLPFDGTVRYLVNWGDNTSQSVDATSTTAVNINHDWPSNSSNSYYPVAVTAQWLSVNGGSYDFADQTTTRTLTVTDSGQSLSSPVAWLPAVLELVLQ